MSAGAGREAAPRRAWRCATACSVHGPTHWAAAVRDRRRRDPGGLGPQAAARRPRRDARARAARGAAAGRGDGRDPAGQARAARGAAAHAGRRACSVAMGAAALAGRRSAPARRAAVAARGGRGRAVAWCPALLALRGGDLAAYHGVEHKAIARLRAGRRRRRRRRQGARPLRLAPGRADAGGQRRRRRRCCAASSGVPGPRPTAAVASASMAVAVEIFAWSERHAETPRPRALLRRPGHEIQRAIGTREPDRAQLEVGRAALAEILRVEGAADRPWRAPVRSPTLERVKWTARPTPRAAAAAKPKRA